MIENILKNVSERLKGINLDLRSRELLLKQAKKAAAKSQKKILKEIETLVENAHQDNRKGLDPILRRCYYDVGVFKNHEHLEYFIRKPLNSWLNESATLFLMGEKQTLERTVKSQKKIQALKYPSIDRDLPSLSKLMNLPSSTDQIIDPLPLIEPEADIKKREFMDEMLRQVLELQLFLSGAGLMHTRKLTTPVAVIPVTPFGDEVAACRKKNIIQKKITYLRGVFTQLPPLRKEDSEYLTTIADKSSSETFDYTFRREYKKFLRKSYIIEPPFKLIMNKYAYSNPQELDKSLEKALES